MFASHDGSSLRRRLRMQAFQLDHSPRAPLLHHITTPAIAVRPEWALRAHLSFGVVDPFLMRATYDSIGHDDRFGAMVPYELEDLACNSRICPDVALLG
jgi:hypothetical protein